MKLRIIPKLEVKGENLIKGINFDGLKVIGDPCEAAFNYFKDGADEIFYDDIVASLYEKTISKDLVKNTSKDISIPLTVAGGIKSMNDIESLLNSGADKVAINTYAAKNPKFLQEASRQFGSQCIVLSVHSKKIQNNYEIFTENGRERTHLELNKWISTCIDLDIGEIFLSSIDNEGLCKGLDENLVMNLNTNNLPISYGGGVGNIDHCLNFLNKHRVDGLFIASAIHYYYYKNKFKNTYEKLSKDIFTELKPFSIFELKKKLSMNNINVRLDGNV